jgi:signal transduction histidine kinase
VPSSKQTKPRAKAESPQLEVQREIIHRSVTATNLPDLMGHIARLTSEASDVPWVTLWLARGEGRELDVVSDFRRRSIGDAAALAEALEGLARNCFESDRAVRVSDVSSEKAFRGALKCGPVSCLFLPMRSHDIAVGVLGVARLGKKGDFSLEDEAFLKSVAEQSALATKNAWYQGIIRRSEERLREMELLLLQNERLAALGEMNARMSRELRNPLSAIGGLARRIARNLPPKNPNREPADLIVKEIQRLEGLLTEYLKMARLSRLRKVATDLNSVVRESLDLLRSQIHEAGILLEESYSPSLPELLLDVDKVRKVVINILTNAMESVEEGDTIHLETYLSEGKAWLEVANTGERIPGEVLDRLFYSFTKGKSGGTSLGMAVSQQIIKDHGGEIRVRSDDNWSVVFTLAFPIPMNREKRVKNRRSGRDRRRAA